MEVTEDRRNPHNELQYFLLHTQHYSGDEIKEGGMGRTCGIYWSKRKCIADFGKETISKKDYLEVLAVYERIILKRILIG
jgi:hypothetical protein